MTSAILLGVAFALGWAPLFYFRTEGFTAQVSSYRRAERFWVVATPIVVSAHVAASCVLLPTLPSVSMHRGLASSLLFVVGISFWFWARRAIGPLGVRRLPGEAPLRFRRDGPFGLVRNPLYFGMLLAAAAPAIAVGRPVFAVTWALCAFSMVVRSIHDERRLREQLGAEYEDYSRQVKRLVPFVW